MKLTTLFVAAAISVSTAVAAETGAEKMERVMAIKTQQWEAARKRGVFGGSGLYHKLAKKEACKKGKAAKEYGCNNVDLHSFLSHEDLGSASKEGNDIWGWTDKKSGREFGIVGQTDGVAFVEVTTGGKVEYLGRLDTQTTVTSWRDIKVIGNHAYIGAESVGHGIQIFNLEKLLQVKPWWNPWFYKPKVFSKETDISFFGGVGATHNIVAGATDKYVYAVGGREGANARNTTCAGGFFVVDISNPSKPTSPGCIGQDGYIHDAQCVIYKGPSKQYRGKEICFGFNEDTLTIYDITSKTNPVVISRTPYYGNAYSHQGWLIDENQSWLLLDDELDEMDKVGPAADGRTTTYIWSVADLTNPVNTGVYKSPAKSIDHNQYVVNGLSYQANYGSGLRIVDVSSVARDPTGGAFKEVGFFDCHPEDDVENGVVEFLGTWSVYPYFKSGYILLNSIERGVYSLKYTGPKAKYRI